MKNRDMIGRIALTLAMSAMTSSIMGVDKLPKVEIFGNPYYVYEIKKGDSVYGIAKEFGWDSKVITRLNPSSVAKMEKGMKIYYPANGKAVKTITAPEEISETAYEPLTHVVKRGETVYSISRLYNIPIEKIYKLHPSSVNGIKEGEVISLSEEGKEGESSSRYKFYKVKKGDTLYGVAKAYSTTVKQLLESNPGVSEKNFRSGSTIRIPKNPDPVPMKVEKTEEVVVSSFDSYKVQKGDDWTSIAAKTGVNKEDLKLANADNSKLKKNEIIAIPRRDTIQVETEVPDYDAREIQATVVDSVSNLASDSIDITRIKAVYVMTEPSVRKDLEFSRGFITALDEMKDKGYPVDFKIIDGTKDKTEVENALISADPDIIYVTTDKSIPDYLAKYSHDNRTLLVNSFDVKSELYMQNPYVIQYLTPSNYFNKGVADKISNEFNGRTILFIGKDEESDNLSDMLKAGMTDSPVINLTAEEFELYPFTDDGKYLIYSFATKKSDISDLLQQVSAAKEEAPLADVAVLGRPNWVMYEDALKSKFYENNVMIPTRFYLDLESEKVKSFISRYKTIFEKGPMKSYPLYAGVGYDVATYFITGLHNAGKDINNLGQSENLLQSSIEMMRPTNWSGIYNPDCYIIKFTPLETVEKILVK